jgi:hypothetical protein
MWDTVIKWWVHFHPLAWSSCKEHQPIWMKLFHTYLPFHHTDSFIFVVKFLLQLLNRWTQFVHLYLQGNPLKTSIILGTFCQTILLNTGYRHMLPEYFNKNIIFLMSHKWNSCLLTVWTLWLAWKFMIIMLQWMK